MKSVIRLLAFLCFLVTAKAEGNITFSSQIRMRYEMVDKDFTNSTGFSISNYLRTRFAVSYNSDDVITFVQLQDSRIFGSETNTLSDGTADALDVHQAYFKLNNLFNLPLNVKVGRFEANYGPQRLIGAVGWHNIGRSFDGVVFNIVNNFADVDFFNFVVAEATIDTSIDEDFTVRGVYANLKLIKGHSSQAFAIQDGDRMTFGGYGKGTFAGVNYEAEFAIQNGAESGAVNYGGMMYGFNAGYKLAGMTFSAGVDFLSGNDSTTTDVNESFNTLYATNHKFYGFMDYFLNLPVHTDGLGLQDVYVKMSGLKLSGHVLNVVYHMFNADQSSDSFGDELDITVVKPFADNVKFVGGYSIFMPEKLMEEDGANGSFVYLMISVNF